MEQLIERCCGLDVHQASLTACVRVPNHEGHRVEVVRTFGTTTPDLIALSDWLMGLGVTHLAMESTGIYWKCVYCDDVDQATTHFHTSGVGAAGTLGTSQ